MLTASTMRGKWSMIHDEDTPDPIAFLLKDGQERKKSSPSLRLACAVEIAQLMDPYPWQVSLRDYHQSHLGRSRLFFRMCSSSGASTINNINDFMAQ